ncbi:MAG: AmmeMemoRadiSam system protein B, partial [Bacteroidales bacterium]|nr:AmmeMemoRadiSam system protein B [Bacteroidales bacterium]
MSRKKNLCTLIVLLAIIFTNCSAQENKKSAVSGNQVYNRQPAVAGQFYPSEKNELNIMLEDIFSEAEPKKTENVLAVISPH